jgi:hypothetical protein
VKAKINPTDTRWVFLSEFEFNDKAPRKSDLDKSGNVDMKDLSIFAGQWLDSGTVVHGETAVLEDFESYPSQEDFGYCWSEYFKSTGTCPVVNLLTSPSSAHSGNNAMRWQYNVTALQPGQSLYAELIYVMPQAVNLSQYDIVHIWLKRDPGNSTEQLLYVKFFNNSTDDNTYIAGEKKLGAEDGSTSSPAGVWSDWQVDLHNLDYSFASGNGYTNLAQITNMAGFMIGTLGQDGGTGFINVDDIVLEKGQLCDGTFTADFNGDCKVNFADFSRFAVDWLFAN